MTNKDTLVLLSQSRNSDARNVTNLNTISLPLEEDDFDWRYPSLYPIEFQRNREVRGKQSWSEENRVGSDLAASQMSIQKVVGKDEPSPILSFQIVLGHQRNGESDSIPTALKAVTWFWGFANRELPTTLCCEVTLRKLCIKCNCPLNLI
jgi:hypothetical protein